MFKKDIEKIYTDTIMEYVNFVVMIFFLKQKMKQ